MVLTWQWHFLVSLAGKQNLERERMPTAIGFKEYLFQKHQAQLSKGFFFYLRKMSLLKPECLLGCHISLGYIYFLMMSFYH